MFNEISCCLVHTCMYVIMLYLGYIKVRAILQRVKVYIDVGPHRGMNRLPHEASLVHCIAITNTSGVSGYPSQYAYPFLVQNATAEGRCDPQTGNVQFEKLRTTK